MLHVLNRKPSKIDIDNKNCYETFHKRLIGFLNLVENYFCTFRIFEFFCIIQLPSLNPNNSSLLLVTHNLALMSFAACFLSTRHLCFCFWMSWTHSINSRSSCCLQELPQPDTALRSYQLRTHDQPRGQHREELHGRFPVLHPPDHHRWNHHRHAPN